MTRAFFGTRTISTGQIIVVRNATPRDVEALAALSVLVHQASSHLPREPDEVTLEEERAAYEKWLRRTTVEDGCIALVAEQQGQIVGQLDLTGPMLRRVVHRRTIGMSVHPAFQGHGVGRLLLEAVIDLARAHATIEVLSLEVFASNGSALSLYRNAGFVVAGRREAYYKVGEDYVDRIDMELSIKTRRSSDKQGSRSRCRRGGHPSDE